MADGQIFNTFNPTFMSSLYLAQKAVNEEPVQVMWNTILNTWFPPVGPQAFKLAIKSPSLASDGQPDAIVIEVRLVLSGPIRNSTHLEEWQIFMVECKSRTQDTQANWAAATRQLDLYLIANNNGSKRLFGAVAIGVKVILYEWEQAVTTGSTSFRPVHAGTLNLGLPADRIVLESALGRIRSQGWTRAKTSI